MKKTLRVFAGLMTALAVLGAGCAPRPVLREQPAITAPQPSMDEMKPLAVVALNGGSATVTRGDATDRVPDGLEVMPGDTIEVTKGTVSLVYPDAGASRLEQGSKVTLLPDGEGSGSVFAHIELVAGSIWTRFERLLGTDEKFSVSGNGVVATVRGTAFGVSLVNGQAEVHVAESEVEIMPLEGRRDPKMAARGMRLKAGDAMRVRAEAMKSLDLKGVQKLIWKSTEREKRMAGYVFAMKKMDEGFLKGPEKRMRLKRQLDIPEALRDRIDPTMMERILRWNTAPQFIAPTLIQEQLELFEVVSSTRELFLDPHR